MTTPKNGTRRTQRECGLLTTSLGLSLCWSGSETIWNSPTLLVSTRLVTKKEASLFFRSQKTMPAWFLGRPGGTPQALPGGTLQALPSLPGVLAMPKEPVEIGYVGREGLLRSWVLRLVALFFFGYGIYSFFPLF
jgi:hypothetical protein